MQLLRDLKRNYLVVSITFIYIVLDMIFTFREIYWVNLLPVLLLIIYLLFARLDVVYFIIVALTPLSIQLLEYSPSASFNFSIPTEPLLFALMLILIYKNVQTGIINMKILNHPVTYAVILNLFWLLLTAITSVRPDVSFKFLLSRLCFVSVYYFLAIMIFQKSKNIKVFIWCYTLPMIVVIFYSVSRHLAFGLYDNQASHFVMNPFFRDHTSYGAVLAMLFFAFGSMIFRNRSPLIIQFFLYGVWILLVIALILSYTRAAWISVVISAFVLGLVLLKIRFRYLLITGLIAIVYLTGQRFEIIRKMEKNRQASSATISEHIKSISNITTDDSNKERINRWNAAMKMFRERPVLGWGPGTYSFTYAPFQAYRDKTIISTNFGDKGNAHSEYIGPLAESGILGSVTYVLIGIMSLLTGFKVLSALKDKRLKQLTLGFILGYITYLIHGTLNNFLDTDKLSALFWGFSAVFVALDISLKELNSKY